MLEQLFSGLSLGSAVVTWQTSGGAGFRLGLSAATRRLVRLGMSNRSRSSVIPCQSHVGLELMR
jgi:hypothetical protein